MVDVPDPDFIIAGPQKCATTWLYEALREHPDVYLPPTDAVHYFDIHYGRGDDWYAEQFSGHDGESVIGEETPTYVRDELAPRRMAETIPDAKIIIILRSPVDRAFSHYWHEKSKDKHSFEFSEIFENYDLFQNWVVPGLYHRHIRRYLDHFSREQLQLLFFRDLVHDDWAYLQDVYDFLDVEDHRPSVLDSKSNEGRTRGIRSNELYTKSVEAFKTHAPRRAVEAVRPIHDFAIDVVASQNEYERGILPEDRKRLEALIVDETRELREFTDRDLGRWFMYESV